MVVFLLEYREDEEDKPSFVKRGPSPLLEKTASFTNGAILMEIYW